MTQERCKRFWRIYAWLGVTLNPIEKIVKECRLAQQKKKD